MEEKSKKSIKKQPDLSRRNFGKLAAGLGATAVMAPFGGAKVQAAEATSQAVRAKYVLPNGKVPIEIDFKKFRRVGRSENCFMNDKTFFRKLGDEVVPWFVVRAENAYQNALQGKTEKDIDIGNVADARAALAASVAPQRINYDAIGEEENRGHLAWHGSPEVHPGMQERAPDETDPNKLTLQTKYMARMAGADLVGVAPLNKNWIYTDTIVPVGEGEHKDYVKKDIVFKDVKIPEETETELVIPESVNNVIVMAVEMNREMLQSTPSNLNNAAVMTGYVRMGCADVTLAEFIRGLGYIAIPCVNGVGVSVPMAVEAGLGEAGRHGVLVTPEYGSNVRITKVLTNMPLNHDKPIDFGVQKFCETCMKCARECPSKTITESTKSYKPRTFASQPGVLKWQNDYPKCQTYWMEHGTTCSNCIAFCPFTKGAMWGHKGVEWLIKNMSFLDPVMLGFDDALGYGERRDEEEVWNTDVHTYGLDPDHLRNSVLKGKLKL